MEIQLAEYLSPSPDLTWQLAKQCGVTHAVSNYPLDADGVPVCDFTSMLHLKQRFADAGLDLAVIETAFPWADEVKRGLPGGDREIEICCEAIRNMGAVGIEVACWNWMTVFNWTRTSTTIPARGGALVTGYDHALMRNAPPTAAGEVSEEQLWEALAYFLERVVPVAEEAKVKLALHPDDPPISPIRGVSRILRSPESMQRAIDLRPSPFNGITMCQGTFSTMGANVPAQIRAFGERGQIHFVHFRDVQGTPERFVETFHDLGQTDMFAAMRAYREIGFAGPLRPDHVPTMAGEDNLAAGYNVLGRLFALGYIKGLIEGVVKTAGTPA